MKLQKFKFKSLSKYVDYLQSQGIYVFTQEEAQKAIGGSNWAIRLAANKLIIKRRIIKLRYTFYLIIPLEYITAKSPPPSWYIDSLMQYHKQPYYVALLSAAVLFGAAHQQPQVFQVITNRPLRSVQIGRAKIQFLIKKSIQKTDITKIQTDTGYMNVSTPEATACDLVRYADQSGSLDHVVTVLIELAEIIDPEKLAVIAQKEKLFVVQRLGYLLEKYAKKNIIKLLLAWLVEQKPRYVLLKPGKRHIHATKNKDWKVIINKKIEVDDL